MAGGKTKIRFDVEAVRKDFPVLSRLVHGKRLAYLDSGASAQKPQCVIDAVTKAYSETYANVHRGLHYLSNTATELYEKSRETVRHFLNAPSAETVVFTKNATEAINTVAYGWGMPNIRQDDEIVITIMEHHSNIVPWHFIRERQGAKLVFVPVDDDGVLHIEDFERALSPRTRMVAITHMSNVLGTVTPVRQMVALAHERNIPVLVDGSQAAVHMPVDVTDIDCDWYVMTGHKLYGPTGIGVLYGKPERLEAMRPFQGGGEMIEDVTVDTVTYNNPPHRFEAGTPPIVQAVGLGAALDYMEGLGRAAIAAHERELTVYLHERLRAIAGLRMIGQAPDKGGIVSFSLDGIHAHDVSMFVDRQGVALRAGTHCAQPLLQRFGMTSACRASLGLYSNREDIDQLAQALEKTRTFFG
ncbi:MAG: SufS subfamily cysteine desulfurase [Candidatus Tokpelaia hoelldobleri]|uniref:Cysteine desulfurase n=1 Tax=Candidatus Tokpelaia hoelldobleri TaxID=1902579 RepID=A0A1U9JUS1_9HYPH|nr:MAG: SufS subfamily cysteine desulfurase [Candidatus Tokpelaia hoelldoblerii]